MHDLKHPAVVRSPLAPDQHHLDIVNASNLPILLSLPEAIELIHGAMQSLSRGAITAPARWSEVVADTGIMALMPGSAPSAARFGIKVLSLFESSISANLPGHQGLMLLFDGQTGRPLSVIDANALTSLRTAAASAVATRALSRPDSGVLALIGCGDQAMWHARAIPLVRPIREVRVWGRSEERVRAFAQHHLGHIPEVKVAPSVRSAVRHADIVCTLTNAREPLLAGEWLEAGQHLNLVGSSTAAHREVDDEVVRRGRLIVDARENTLREGGELLHAIEAGIVDVNHIHAEIGEVLAGLTSGREDDQMITMYKSLGHVAQDLAVATEVEKRLQNISWRDRIAWC